MEITIFKRDYLLKMGQNVYYSKFVRKTGNDDQK